ncbi:MAG: hypothetical protein IJX39_08075 [Clostridia bacterium]|nr:hypothetical protein [Clostridia bacterium]
MIKPNKLTDPKNCIVFNSYKILYFLREEKIATYQEVLKNQLDIVGEDSSGLFLLSLNFLFALGKINYIEETDSLEIIYETE